WDFLMRWPMPQSRHDVHPRGAFTRDGLCPKAAKKTRGANSQPRVVKVVPKGGLEPPRLSAPPPQGGASTNSATWAKVPVHGIRRAHPYASRLVPEKHRAHPCARLFTKASINANRLAHRSTAPNWPVQRLWALRGLPIAPKSARPALPTARAP